jgi:hypothetical protein
MSIDLSSQSKRRPLLGWLIATLAIIVIGYSSTRYFVDRINYNEGFRAFYNADCATAIRHFNIVINGWRLIDIGGYSARAQSIKEECLPYQEAVEKQQSGDLSSALVAYADFAHVHPIGPLNQGARDRITSLFEQPSELASEGSCRIIKTLLEQNLILQQEINLPPFYFACAQIYEKDGAWGEVIAMYNNIVADYPGHTLASDAEAAMAQLIITHAKEIKGGELYEPGVSGTTSTGTTEVVIENFSSARLFIVFTGPELRVEKLEACESCPDYGIGSLWCPESGGKTGYYALAPGQYDVLIVPIGSDEATLRGDWHLLDGSSYLVFRQK